MDDDDWNGIELLGPEQWIGEPHPKTWWAVSDKGQIVAIAITEEIAVAIALRLLCDLVDRSA